MLLKPAGSLRPAAYRSYLNDTGHLVANIGGLLVQRGTRALLIDTGLGPHSVPARPEAPADLVGATGPPGRRAEPADDARRHGAAAHGGSLPGNLARLGPGPEGIEVVAFTRLHLDQLGWASVRPPVFTRATFVVPAGAWDGPVPELPPALRRRLRRVVPGEEVFPGVRALALPGHTGFTITSRGERLLAFGGALHSPVQVRHPEWSLLPDADPRGATARRRRLIAELQRADTLGFGSYFADVVFGRVRLAAEGLHWHPE
ncbi:MBL fold metallo-hydrolase [Streptomyces sp. 3MP-14]|uniref:MBL fold metallo-hydrolase n=2 Tax=Streptomyces TaxID=1883 RepID=A0A5N6A1G5_9ACTN|nr:MBL fold metallo-hydrolase [Streptomyces mimosae]KAB8173989.1 MBL fold metallo-hydrolase [Streptomyces sp. 3MP-14]